MPATMSDTLRSRLHAALDNSSYYRNESVRLHRAEKVTRGPKGLGAGAIRRVWATALKNQQ